MQINNKKTGYPSVDKPWLHLITPGNTTGPSPRTTIYRLLREYNENNMNKTALIYMGTKISFAELFENIHKLANAFTAIGVKAGDIVPIFSSNTPETVYAFYALNYIGAVPDFEYATISEKGAVQAVNGCNAKVVLVLDKLLPGIAKICDQPGVEHVIPLPVAASLPPVKRVLFKLMTKKNQAFNKEMSYSDFVNRGKDTTATEHPYKADEFAVIVHSGGTTGKPKGVMLSNESVIYINWAINHNFEYCEPNDKGMCFIPMFHAFGLCLGLVTPLSSGVTLILSPQFEEDKLHAQFIKYKPEHIIAGGSHVNSFIQNEDIGRMNLSFLKTFVYGGSGLTPTMEVEMDEFLKAHHAIARPNCGYGMSELASGAVCERNGYYGKVGSTGIPFAEVNVKAINVETGEELGYNQQGELCIDSPGLMLGYFNDEEETNNAIFTDESGTRWIHTGDVGYIDEDGFVFITGRIKRIYSTRSEPGGTMFKIFPDYITNTVSAVDNVDNCAVVCVKHPDYVNVAVVFAVLRDESEKTSTEEAIWDSLKEEFPTHCLPKAVEFIDSIPLTKIGKPDWAILEARAENIIK